MLKKLARLAQVSAALRKEAFLGSAVKGVGKWMMKSPGNALTGGLAAMGTGFGIVGAKGKFKQYKAGFDPEVQKVMMGQAPSPPGSEQ